MVEVPTAAASLRTLKRPGAIARQQVDGRVDRPVRPVACSPCHPCHNGVIQIANTTGIERIGR